MNREFARRLAIESLNEGKPLSWFEKLYASGKKDSTLIPWADFEPNSKLIEFLNKDGNEIKDGSCLVVGCGLGDDPEYLASLGFRIDAFDISATCIEMCKDRYSGTRVNYFVDDITNPKIISQYDLVVEIYTLQVLPPDVRAEAIRILPTLLKIGGHLLIICRGRNKDEYEGDMPWPLTVEELEQLKRELKCVSFEDYFDTDEEPKVRRFRALFKK